jgi:hypothetical protein
MDCLKADFMMGKYPSFSLICLSENFYLHLINNRLINKYDLPNRKDKK